MSKVDRIDQIVGKLSHRQPFIATVGELHEALIRIALREWVENKKTDKITLEALGHLNPMDSKMKLVVWRNNDGLSISKATPGARRWLMKLKNTLRKENHE